MDLWLYLHETRSRDLIREAEAAKRRRDLRRAYSPRAGRGRDAPRLEQVEARVRGIRQMIQRGEERSAVLQEISAVVDVMDELAADVLEKHLRH